MAGEFSPPASHMYRPLDAATPTTLRLKAAHVGIFALLLILVNGATSMHREYDQCRCEQFLLGFLCAQC